ncbi:U3 small nucleolar RNA-associated protein 5 [Cyphellophora attinorum]|uniref:U3 small nucleolar RNA-associated protein 5 n=1 Tax=Cyphellophora attinorum TaxID=1664694 RepID=A0A0N0NMZ2_9EURO|nr:U3 small nucleolar RNA-associated protein 5 [Phialophora attinorum]KPI40779.1 U3 small nucleolar RNA-associated protein 5 [Phialophora attinorum]
MAKSQPTSTAKVAAATNSTTQKSSILKSSFAPSRLQLRLFASVIQSFDSQQLRIHDTATGRLRSQHAGKAGSRITCMDWGHTRPHTNGTQPSKSRKKDDVLLAYGTSTSEICLFAPTEGRVVAELQGQHERGILDLKFAEDTNNLWSIGGDGRLVQWDVVSKKALQSISLPESSIQTLAPILDSSAILCASSRPHLLYTDKSAHTETPTFDSMAQPIHSIYQSSDSILAADGERYINMYRSNGRLSRTLLSKSGVQNFTVDAGDVSVVAEEDQQLLAALGKDGTVELFPKPFAPPQSQNGLKSSRKDLTQKPVAQVKLIDSSSKQTPIFAASIQGGEIILASVTGGVDLNFQKVRWQDDGSGELLFAGSKEVVQSRSAASLGSANVNGVKDMGKPYVDESSTVVTNGLGVPGSQEAAIDIESSSSDDEEADSEDEAGADLADGKAESDVESDEEMADAPPAGAPSSTVQVLSSDAQPPADDTPTFGDLLAAQEPSNKIVSITSAFPDTNPPFTNSSGALTIPTGMSLGTVLTQALRTNDRSLLEACLHTSNPDIIRNTITRLEPPLAGPLISKLADRIISRPGRYGHLQIWVQHLCVAHGAAISSNTDARDRLKTLYRALDQRAKGLPSLLLLKGKLQMVEGQLRFRREIAEQRAELGGGASGTRNVNVFIEGEADNWDSDTDVENDGPLPKKRAKKDLAQLVGQADDSNDDTDVDDDSDEEEMPAALTNGIAHASDSDSDNESHSSRSANGALLDDEAEESAVEDDESLESGSASTPNTSDSDEEASSRDGEEEEDDEDDSEMEGFINDGEVSVATSGDSDEVLHDAPVEEEEEVIVQSKKEKKREKGEKMEKPKVKRRKV